MPPRHDNAPMLTDPAPPSSPFSPRIVLMTLVLSSMLATVSTSQETSSRRGDSELLESLRSELHRADHERHRKRLVQEMLELLAKQAESHEAGPQALRDVVKTLATRLGPGSRENAGKGRGRRDRERRAKVQAITQTLENERRQHQEERAQLQEMAQKIRQEAEGRLEKAHQQMAHARERADALIAEMAQEMEHQRDRARESTHQMREAMEKRLHDLQLHLAQHQENAAHEVRKAHEAAHQESAELKRALQVERARHHEQREELEARSHQMAEFAEREAQRARELARDAEHRLEHASKAAREHEAKFRDMQAALDVSKKKEAHLHLELEHLRAENEELRIHLEKATRELNKTRKEREEQIRKDKISVFLTNLKDGQGRSCEGAIRNADRESLSTLLGESRHDSRPTKTTDTVFRSLQEKRGPDHPSTLKALAELAHQRTRQGEFEHALDAFDELSSRHRRTKGSDASETLACDELRAALLIELGHGEQAQALAQQVLERRVRLQGNDHPRTLMSRELSRLLENEKPNMETIMQRLLNSNAAR